MKKLLSLLLVIVMVIGSVSTGLIGFAAGKEPDKSEGKILLDVSAEKNHYKWGEEVVFNVSVKNNTTADYKNVKVRAQANKVKYFYDGESNTVNVDYIAAGETKVVQIKVKSSVPNLLQRILVLPLYYIIDYFSPMAFRPSNYDATNLVRVGIFRYWFGFDVTDGTPVSGSPDTPVDPTQSNIQFTINQRDFTTTEVDADINGTITSALGLNGVVYSVLTAVDNQTTEWKPVIIDGNNWEATIRLKTGLNTVTVTATDVSGATKRVSVNITYDMGAISVPGIGDFEDHGDIAYRKGVLLVYFKDSVQNDEAVSIISSAGGTVIGQNNFMKMYQASFGVSSYDALMAKKTQLEGNRNVSVVLFEELYESGSITVADPWDGDVSITDWNDADVDGSNWGLEAIDVQSAWEHNDRLSQQPARIGVVDTDFDLSHVELTNSGNSSYTLVNGNGQSSFLSNHGTHVAGTISAVPNNSQGLTGINWNTNMYLAAAGTSASGLSSALIADGIERTIINGAKVVNLSLGRTTGDSNSARTEAAKIVVEAMVPLLEKGYDFLLVQSAGNSHIPASRNSWVCAFFDGMDISYATNRYTAQDLIDHSIVVASVRNEKSADRYLFANSSNYGTRVDIAAPGGHIYSTLAGVEERDIDGNIVVSAGQQYGYKSGTSMAAPHVTGVVGLLWSINNTLPMKKIKEIICSDECTTEAYDSDQGGTYRMLNAGLAVQKVIDITDATGVATGRFVDATNGQAVASGRYIIHKTDATGEVFATKNFSNGQFSFVAPAGQYVLEINADGGYVTRYLTVVIVPNDTVNCGDIPLSKQLSDNQLRIVLSWGVNPSDLDSHIAGTTTNGNAFHVYYPKQGFYEKNGEGISVDDLDFEAYGDPICWLDIDDTSSYGPETVTVVDMSRVRSFKYYIHNYSDRYATSDDSEAFNLADSGATVSVYQGDSLIATYVVPVNHKGTQWDVFSMDAAGRITVLNRMYYHEDPDIVS